MKYTFTFVAFSVQDKRIIGATCSTDDAKEYRFSSEVISQGQPNAGKRVYKCFCKGRSDLMPNPGNVMQCFLHYWQCPLKT